MVLRRLKACAVLRIHGIGGLLSITTPPISTHFYGNFCNTACSLLIYILHGHDIHGINVNIAHIRAVAQWVECQTANQTARGVRSRPTTTDFFKVFFWLLVVRNPPKTARKEIWGSCCVRSSSAACTAAFQALTLMPPGAPKAVQRR